MAVAAKLTPFEWIMLQQDKRSPMTILVQLRMLGLLEPECFRKAIAKTIQRHPMLDSVLQLRQPVLQSEWRRVSLSPESIKFQGLEQPFETAWSRPIDIESESGLRVLVRNDMQCCDIRLYIHHACCDGKGAIQFVEDLLCCYDQMVGGNAKMRRIDENAIHLRGQHSFSTNSIAKRLCRSFLVRPYRALKMLVRKSDPIACDMPPANGHAENDECEWDHSESLPRLTFSQNETRLIADVAKKWGVKLNEFLLGNLFLTIRDWNLERNGPNKQHLRILVPFSLRNRKHSGMSAANCVSMAFVDASSSKISSSRSLCLEMAKQINFLKTWRMQFAFNQTAKLVASSRFLTWMTQRRSNRPMSTTVLSNLGRVFKDSVLNCDDQFVVAGNLKLDSLLIVPPVDTNTPATFGCHFYRDRLNVAMNYRAESLDDESARLLLSSLGERIRMELTAHEGIAKTTN